MWQIPVFLRSLTGHIIAPIIVKYIVGLKGREMNLLLVFSFCLLFSLPFGLAGGILADGLSVTGIVMGFVNAFATYFAWRAIDISLTKNSLFTFWDDIIGMSLSFFILGEARFLNWPVGLGIALAVLSTALFVRHAYLKRKKRKEEGDGTPLIFFIFVGAYSLIWGGVFALIKILAVAKTGTSEFLVSWYAGAFLGGCLIFWRSFRRRREVGAPADRLRIKKDAGLTAVLASCTILSLWFAFWAFQLAPQIVVQPIFLVSEMVFPSIVGLCLFKENKQFDKAEWLYFALGAGGAILIALRPV